MGHYDDARERYEERVDREDAESRGMTLEEYRAAQLHDSRYERGRILHERRKAEQADIDFYISASWAGGKKMKPKIEGNS